MASNVTIELTLQKDVLLAIPTDPTPTLPTPDDPLPWEHSFHHKFLTLNFAGIIVVVVVVVYVPCNVLCSHL